MGAALADDVNYSYDPLGRLSRADYASGKSIVYNYDAAGNRTQVVYNGGNGAPTAVNDAYSMNENTALTRDPRLNDTDPDGDSLTITAAGPPSHGTVIVINSGQSIKYTPTTGFHGTDSFGYTISDGHNPGVLATVTVTVNNRAPTATTDNVSTNFNTAKQFDPRSNDSDPDGDALTVTAPSSAVATAHGSVTGNATSVTYTPNNGYSGPDTFTYTISDGQGHTANGTVNMTVSPANRAPTAVDDTGFYRSQTTTGHPVTPFVSLDPRANDTDPDGDSLTVTSVTNGTQGTVVITGGGTGVTYTYQSAVFNLETTDTFTYTISDGHNHTATANVTVTLDVTKVGGN